MTSEIDYCAPIVKIGTTEFYTEWPWSHYGDITIDALVALYGDVPIGALAFEYSSTENAWDYFIESGDITIDALVALYGDATLDYLAYLNSVDTGNPIKAESASILHQIEDRSTADFEFLDLNALYHFEYGQEVTIWDINDGIKLFGGLITEAREKKISQFSPYGILHSISCSDYHILAENRMFYGAYELTTGKAVVEDILTILEEEDISAGLIQDGDVLENLKINYMSCAEALDKVSVLCGYTWFIDENKRLYFMDRSTYTADWHISDGSEYLANTFECIKGNPEYRNVQYLTGTSALTSLQTEYFIGDGVIKSFPLGYPASKEPVISLNSVLQEVGIGGVETGKDWYWNKGNNIITQDNAGTPLEADDLLEVQYYGQFKLMVKVSQAAEITRQKAAQGFGSGKIEKISSDPSIYDTDSALDAARAKLGNYAVIGDKVSYETIIPGLAAGTLQHIDRPLHELDNDLLITSIQMDFKHKVTHYQINAVLGPVEESWEKLFCRMAMEAKLSASASEDSESDTVNGLETFSKTWELTDHPNPFIQIFPGSSTFPNDADFPCLDSSDYFKYIVLYKSGNEFFRKAITVQSIGATEISTTAIVLALEGNFAITHVGLWGGNLATAVAGTGIEMEKFVYVHTKNSLESLQFDFTNSKGW